MVDETTPDWAQIEADFRAGVKSLRQIASEHGISEGAIRKRAKKEDWDRDLSAKISAKADALVRKDAVRSEVRSESRVPENEIIEANAALQAQVRREQRKDISRARNLVMTLFNELEAQTLSGDLLEQLASALQGEDESAGSSKRMELFNKVVSLSGRTTTMKSLSDSLKTLVGLERQAFNIPDEAPKGGDNQLTAEQRRARIAQLQAKLDGTDG